MPRYSDGFDDVAATLLPAHTPNSFGSPAGTPFTWSTGDASRDVNLQIHANGSWLELNQRVVSGFTDSYRGTASFSVPNTGTWFVEYGVRAESGNPGPAPFIGVQALSGASFGASFYFIREAGGAGIVGYEATQNGTNGFASTNNYTYFGSFVGGGTVVYRMEYNGAEIVYTINGTEVYRRATGTLAATTTFRVTGTARGSVLGPIGLVFTDFAVEAPDTSSPISVGGGVTPSGVVLPYLQSGAVTPVGLLGVDKRCYGVPYTCVADAAPPTATQVDVQATVTPNDDCAPVGTVTIF